MAECAFELAPGVLERVQTSRPAPGGKIVKFGDGEVDVASVPPCAGSFADHGMLEPTTSAEPPAEAKKIRDLCGRPRVMDAQGVIDFIDRAAATWTAAELAAAVSAGNRNEKAPIHFAAQMRTDDDCVTMCKALIDRGATVNATTLRGHTPLIFAAGRGRDTAVRFLLAHGANARVMTVTGHSAAQMGKGRLSPETQAQLELAESTQASEWRDFRDDARALDAQAEHVLHCPSCRAKAAAAAGGALTMPCAKRTPAGQVELATVEETERWEVKQVLDSVVTDVEATVCLGDELLVAFATVSQDTESHENAVAAASDALIAAATLAKPHGSLSSKESRKGAELLASGSILRLGMRRLIAAKPPVGLLLLLRVCREENLGRALSRRQLRDRRPIRTVLAALLTELRHLAGVSSVHTLQPLLGIQPKEITCALATLTTADLIAAADPHLAMEVMHLRRTSLPPQMVNSEQERKMVQQLWRIVVGSDIVREEGGYMPEVALICARQLRKKEGGVTVMLWARCVRWVVGMATGGYSIDSEIAGGTGIKHWRLRRTPQMMRQCQVVRHEPPSVTTPEPQPEALPVASTTSMQQTLPTWCLEMLREVGVAAAAKGKTHLLIDAIEPVPAHVSRVWGTKPGHPLLPPQVTQILQECGTNMGSDELGLSPNSIPPASQKKDSDSMGLQAYSISNRPVWVGATDTVGIAAVLAELQGMVNSAESAMWVGVDTEWGETADAAGQDAPPAVIQLAAKEQKNHAENRMLTWVIDSSTPSVELCNLIRWMFDCADVTVLGTWMPGHFANYTTPALMLNVEFQCSGFAFSHDLERLLPLTRSDTEEVVAELPFVDIQKVAMAHENGVCSATGRAHTPGLASVAQQWLQKTLDKGEQCSDWDARPLTEQQLQYAACDAAVLIDIAEAMGLSSA